MSYQINAEPTIGVPIQPPQFTVQCAEIRKTIEQIREKLTFVTVRNVVREDPSTLRDGHLNGELQDIQTQLKDLLGSIQY